MTFKTQLREVILWLWVPHLLLVKLLLILLSFYWIKYRHLFLVSLGKFHLPSIYQFLSIIYLYFSEGQVGNPEALHRIDVDWVPYSAKSVYDFISFLCIYRNLWTCSIFHKFLVKWNRRLVMPLQVLSLLIPTRGTVGLEFQMILEIMIKFLCIRFLFCSGYLF